MMWFILALACTEEKQETEEEALLAPEGLFTITSYAYNADGCDSFGEEMLDTIEDRHMFFIAGSVFGQDYVSAYGCSDESACTEMQEKIANQESFMLGLSYTFSEQDEEGNLLGQSQSTGWTSSDGMCLEPEQEDIILRILDSGAIEIESIIITGDDYPEDEDGFCTTDAAAEACANKECSGAEKVVLEP